MMTISLGLDTAVAPQKTVTAERPFSLQAGDGGYRYLGIGEHDPSYLSLPPWSVDGALRTALKLGTLATSFFAVTGKILGLPRTVAALAALGFTAISTLWLYRWQRRALGPSTACVFPPLSSMPALGVFSKNDILVTRDVKESTQWRKKLIQKAQHSIEISGCYCGGEVFDEMLELIEQRLASSKQLQVRILTCNDFVTADNRRRIGEIGKAFPSRFQVLQTPRQVVFFPRLQFYENHAKMCVVDEEYFLIGGSNAVDGFNRDAEEIDILKQQLSVELIVGIGSRDMDVVAKGPAARAVRYEFYKLWAKWKRYTETAPQLSNEYFSVPHKDAMLTEVSDFEGCEADVFRDVDVAFVAGSREQGQNNSCAKALFRLFDSAKKSVVVANMVFNQEDLIEALEQATFKGVTATVITNGNRAGERTPGKRVLGISNRYNYHRLAEGNSTFYEYDVSGQFYHKKVTVIDGAITSIGSANISKKSVACDDEIMVVINSRKVAKRVLEVLEEDKRRSAAIAKADIPGYHQGWNALAARVISFFNRHIMN